MLGGDDGRTLFIAAAEWRGPANMFDEPRTGQVLTVEAPAPGAGHPSPMASEGERIVRQMYAAFNQPGSLEETLAMVEPLLHPDTEYVNPPDAVEPGTRRGAAGWRAVLESQRTGLGPAATAELDELVVRGDRVFVRSSLRTGGGASGVEVDGPTIGGVWTIRDGLIRRFEWRWDAEEARALFESEAAAATGQCAS